MAWETRNGKPLAFIINWFVEAEQRIHNKLCYGLICADECWMMGEGRVEYRIWHAISISSEAVNVINKECSFLFFSLRSTFYNAEHNQPSLLVVWCRTPIMFFFFLWFGNMKRNLFNFIYYVILCHNFNFMVSLSSFVSKPILIHFAVAMIVSNVKIHAISVIRNERKKNLQWKIKLDSVSCNEKLSQFLYMRGTVVLKCV